MCILFPDYLDMADVIVSVPKQTSSPWHSLHWEGLTQTARSTTAHLRLAAGGTTVKELGDCPPHFKSSSRAHSLLCIKLFYGNLPSAHMPSHQLTKFPGNQAIPICLTSSIKPKSRRDLTANIITRVYFALPFPNPRLFTLCQESACSSPMARQLLSSPTGWLGPHLDPGITSASCAGVWELCQWLQHAIPTGEAPSSSHCYHRFGPCFPLLPPLGQGYVQYRHCPLQWEAMWDCENAVLLHCSPLSPWTAHSAPLAFTPGSPSQGDPSQPPY